MREISLLHAERIITGLLEAVINKAEHPLTVNRLDGDAAFLYAVAGGQETEVAQDAVKQVRCFLQAFRDKALEYSKAARACLCDACHHIGDLRLIAVPHCGEVASKQIRQFEELAGEDVILIIVS